MAEFHLITDHIARLDLPVQFAGIFRTHVSVWLARSQEDFLMIDSGPPDKAGEMVDAVSSATNGRGPKVVLLTHGHFNHAGGLTALRLAWNPPMASHAEETPFVTGERDYARVRSKNPAYWLGSILMETTPWSIPNVQAVEQGRELFGLTVVHLPGHTPGHIGFFHKIDKALICGDALMNVSGRLSRPFGLSTHDMLMAEQSIRRLAERNFIHLLPSHGNPILEKGRNAVFEYAQKRLRKRGKAKS
jgi:glyoxylase-like metal-dependent hydrolase (beta-lactamase superfamily II)